MHNVITRNAYLTTNLPHGQSMWARNVMTSVLRLDVIWCRGSSGGRHMDRVERVRRAVWLQYKARKIKLLYQGRRVGKTAVWLPYDSRVARLSISSLRDNISKCPPVDVSKLWHKTTASIRTKVRDSRMMVSISFRQPPCTYSACPMRDFAYSNRWIRNGYTIDVRSTILLQDTLVKKQMFNQPTTNIEVYHS